MIDWTKPIRFKNSEVPVTYVGEEEGGVHALVTMGWDDAYTLIRVKGDGGCVYTGEVIVVNDGDVSDE